ncbi:L-2-amino-thiazoline-4-carboxylic acid hydrolase [Peribacillus simplex]|uniref:L-2-amino-thiazoline-4-carboxylic acid hydrolase n=1 Tax=Peribacillus simplex TaxID=1478 RepID=UPI003D2C5A7F
MSESLTMKALSMDVITAKMFTEIDIAVTDKFGEKGRQLIKAGLEHFGLKDSEALAKKATAEGENHTFYNYLPKQVEGEEKYAALTSFARFSKMFAQLTKQIVDEYGKEGEDTISLSVRRFGEKRGKGIAQRARTNDTDNSIENYLTNYDMGRSDLFKIDTKYKDQEIEQTFIHCPLGQQWADDNMHQYGILYCQEIDPAIARGYNPNMKVVHDKYVLKEGQCHFQFQLKAEASND